MSYPNNSKERLVKLYGFTLSDFQKINEECKKEKKDFDEKVEELDKALAASVMAQIIDKNFILH